MRPRMLLVLAVFAILPIAVASAQQSSAPVAPEASFLATSSDIHSGRTLVVSNLAPDTSVVIVLFDPTGGQRVSQARTDSTGTLTQPFAAPLDGWLPGVYRAVAGNPGQQSVSATFSISDGKPELFAGPGSPAPTSAFVLSGTGFSPNQSVNLVLSLAGDLGERSFQVGTDSSGSFTSFVWPEQYGFPFWSAGRYGLSAPLQSAGITFWVQEHPGLSFLTVADPVVPDHPTAISYSQYAPGRFLWTVYADASGRALGQFLLGPLDGTGSTHIEKSFPNLPTGQYLLATPYDWGEAAFSLIAPTPTSTPTLTMTPQPTASPTVSPTTTRTPRPTPTRARTVSKRHRATPTPTRTRRHRSCVKHRIKGKVRCRA